MNWKWNEWIIYYSLVLKKKRKNTSDRFSFCKAATKLLTFTYWVIFLETEIPFKLFDTEVTESAAKMAPMAQTEIPNFKYWIIRYFFIFFRIFNCAQRRKEKWKTSRNRKMELGVVKWSHHELGIRSQHLKNHWK